MAHQCDGRSQTRDEVQERPSGSSLVDIESFCIQKSPNSESKRHEYNSGRSFFIASRIALKQLIVNVNDCHWTAIPTADPRWHCGRFHMPGQKKTRHKAAFSRIPPQPRLRQDSSTLVDDRPGELVGDDTSVVGQHTAGQFTVDVLLNREPYNRQAEVGSVRTRDRTVVTCKGTGHVDGHPTIVERHFQVATDAAGSFQNFAFVEGQDVRFIAQGNRRSARGQRREVQFVRLLATLFTIVELDRDRLASLRVDPAPRRAEWLVGRVRRQCR
jgi:hypothetical protein